MSEEKSKKIKVAVIGAGKTVLPNPEQTGGGAAILVQPDISAPEPTKITNPYSADMIEPYVAPVVYKSGKELRRERRARERKQKKMK